MNLEQNSNYTRKCSKKQEKILARSLWAIRYILDHSMKYFQCDEHQISVNVK